MSYELRYFSGYSKGLGPALVAEFSGVPWKGNKDLGYNAVESWGTVKPTAPFGQMPLLTTPEGATIAQTAAIINYLAKVGGIEGEGMAFATSQMLLAEAEDIYQLMVKFMPTVTDSGMRFNLGEGGKGTRAQYDALFAELLPTHLGYLEKLCAKGVGFAAPSPGGLFLFSILYQLLLVRGDLLSEAAFPTLKAWYDATLANETTKKVVEGRSSHGPFKAYFVMPE